METHFCVQPSGIVFNYIHKKKCCVAQSTFLDVYVHLLKKICCFHFLPNIKLSFANKVGKQNCFSLLSVSINIP